MKKKDVRSMKLTMQLKSRSYDIILKAGCLANLHQFTNVQGRKVFVLTDSGVPADYAKIVAGQIYLKPDSVLGLATGSTPLSMYKKLIAVHEMIGLDFSQVTTFNLDEYIGMAPDNPQSYHYFMHHNFFDFINIKPENIYIPDGMAKDIVAEGKRYDALIEAKGGIDLQINVHALTLQPLDS